MCRCLLGVPFEFVQQLAADGIPYAGDHIIAHADNAFTVWRNLHAAQPFGVGFLAADRFPGLAIPPDQMPIPSAGHHVFLGESHTHDIALVSFSLERFGLGFFSEMVHIVNAKIGRTEIVATAFRHASHAERDAFLANFLGRLEVGLFIVSHRVSS